MYTEIRNSDPESRDDHSPLSGLSVQSGQTSTTQPVNPNNQTKVGITSEKLILSCSKIMSITITKPVHNYLPDLSG